MKAAAVPDLSTRLPKPDVFYFDRTSRGAVTLAQNAKKAGAIVMFELSSESDPALLADALAAAHIVKVASDRLRGNENLIDIPPASLPPVTTANSDYSRGERIAYASRGRHHLVLPITTAYKMNSDDCVCRSTATRSQWQERPPEKPVGPGSQNRDCQCALSIPDRIPDAWIHVALG